jgi:hypothetical protein
MDCFPPDSLEIPNEAMLVVPLVFQAYWQRSDSRISKEAILGKDVRGAASVQNFPEIFREVHIAMVDNHHAVFWQPSGSEQSLGSRRSTEYDPLFFQRPFLKFPVLFQHEVRYPEKRIPTEIRGACRPSVEANVESPRYIMFYGKRKIFQQIRCLAHASLPSFYAVFVSVNSL